MKKSVLKVCFIVFSILLVSCTKNNQSQPNSSKIKFSGNIVIDKNFKEYLNNFKELNIDGYDTIKKTFEHVFNENELSIKQMKLVSASKRKEYLFGIKYSQVYYGYKTILSNNSIMLIYFADSTRFQPNKDADIETKFFTACIYNSRGSLISHINIMGTNACIVDPTYALISNLKFSKNNLIITSYEYSYRKEEYDSPEFNQGVEPYYLKGDLLTKKCKIDFNSNKIVLLGLTKKDAKIKFSNNSIFLLLIDPQIKDIQK